MQDPLNLISNNLNIWTLAKIKKKSGPGRISSSGIKIYGIKKLRELIFDLAISGKLINDKYTNNTGNSVLKNIEKEIIELTKKGLLAKRKPLIPVRDEEKIFKLTKNWEWIRLGNTGNIFNGDSINKKEKELKYTNLKNGRPYIATKDVGYGQEKLDYDNGISIPFNEKKFKIAKKNSVLICSEGGSAGKKIGITEMDICFGNKLFANETFSAINPKFIFYTYQSPSFFKSFSKRMTGIIGGISINQFLNIPVAIPSLNLQNDIVAKVDELMLLCDELEQEYMSIEDVHEKLVKNILKGLNQSENSNEFKDNWKRILKNFDDLFINEESIDQLKKTFLQLAVSGRLVPQDFDEEPATELLKKIQIEKKKSINKNKVRKNITKTLSSNTSHSYNLPKNWVWTKLSDVTFINPRNAAEDNTEVSFVSMPSINKEFTENHLEEGKKWKEIKKGYTHFAEGDIAIAKITPCFENSKACIFKNLRNGIGAGTTEIYVVRIIKNTLDAKYILAYLKSPNFLDIGKSKMTGTAGQKRLPKEFLEHNPFPLPPLKEQKRIVKMLDDLMILCEALKSRIKERNLNQKKIADVFISESTIL